MWKWEIAYKSGYEVHMNPDCREWSRSRLCNRGKPVQLLVTTQTPHSENGHRYPTNVDVAI